MKLLIQTLLFFFLVTQISFAQWYQQNSGTTKNLHAVQFIDANTGWAVGDSGKIICTTNGGMNWQLQTSGTSLSLLALNFINETNGWICGWNGIVLKTTNSGINWTVVPVPYGEPLYDVCFIDVNKGFVVGGEYQIMYGAWGTILRTTNGGDTWTDQSLQNSFFCRGISFSNEFNGIVVGGRREALGVPWGNIYRTTDGGINWFFAYESFETGSLIRIESTQLNYIWTVGDGANLSNGRILYSNDGGLNWSSQGVFSNSIYDVSFINASTGWAVGQSGIILYTTNGGLPVELTSFTATANGNEVILNWITATETNNQGFEIERQVGGRQSAVGNGNWKTIGFVPGFGTTTEPKIYSYTDSKVSTGKYAYRLKQIDFDGSFEYSPEVEVEVSAPLVFSLEQNYPNPFNPNTKIKYSVPQSSQVQIKVFDVLGNEIETLVNEEKPAGTYELTWNAEQLPSGVYFYQLKAGEFVQIKKMILIK